MSLRRHAIVNNLVDELRLEKLDCFCVCVCSSGAGFISATVFSNIGWHLHLDDLFDDSLWDMLLARDLRLRTTVFAGAVNVTLSKFRVFLRQSIPSTCFREF